MVDELDRDREGRKVEGGMWKVDVSREIVGGWSWKRKVIDGGRRDDGVMKRKE